MKCGYSCITNKTYNSNQVGLKFVLNIANGKLLKLSRLIYISEDNSILVVFTGYTRFLKKLKIYQDEIDKIFDNKVEELIRLLPDYGKELAADSKAINSHGRPNKSNKADGRRETEADWGVKRYKGKREDGEEWEKTKKWFGYKVHTVVDSKYDLPISYKITKASVSDNPELLKMVEKIEDKHKVIIGRAKRLRADRGYDSEENNKQLWDMTKRGIA